MAGYDQLAGMHERDWESLFLNDDGTPRWPVEREGGWRVASAFALHVSVLALLCAIQALWLRRLGRYATPDSPRA